MPEAINGLPLIRTHGPALFAQRDGVGLTIDIAGQVLCGPTDFEQLLFEVAPLGRVHDNGVGVRSSPEQRLDPFVPQHFFEHRPVCGVQDEAVGWVLLKGQPAIARHGLGNVDEQWLRHGIPAEAQQCVDDLLRVVTGSASVPQAERRHPIGVDVLGGAFQFGKRRDGAAGGFCLRMIDFEQQGLVALDDQRAVGHRLIVAANTR